MIENAAGRVPDEISDLFPPRATEYRSAAVAAQRRASARDEPATEPLALPPATGLVP